MSKKARLLFVSSLMLGCLLWFVVILRANNHPIGGTAVFPFGLRMQEDFSSGHPKVEGGVKAEEGGRAAFDQGGERPVICGTSKEKTKKEGGNVLFFIQRGPAIEGSKDRVPPAAVALSTAVGQNDMEAVKEMIDRGIDVNSRMKDTRQTPLMGAESAEMVSLLLKAGGDPRLVDSQGATALHYAVLKERAPAMILFLLSAGANVNAVEPGGGETPFLWAKQWFFGMDAIMGQRVLALLLQKGADINAKDKFGDTLLHIAVMNGKGQLVKFLLDKGADASLANTEGRTPLDTARDLKFFEIESLLGKDVKHQSR